MVKISKNWLTHPVFAIPQGFRYCLVGTVSIQNTPVASDMILGTSYSNEKVKKMDFGWFKLQIVAEIDIFLHFLILRLREF